MTHSKPFPTTLTSLICLSIISFVAACTPLSPPPTPTMSTPPTPTPEIFPTPLSFGEPIEAFAQAEQLGRGINFANALEAPNEGEWGLTLEERYFDLAKEGGFATIRLPIRWSAHAEAQAPYTIDETFFRRIDWAIAHATRRGLNIVLDMHHYEELMTKPDEHRARFVALWTQIAEHYQNQPATVVFELCNEPNSMSASKWNPIAQEALAAVRKTNPTRNVIIGGTDWNSIPGLMDLKLPEDDRHIIATFHYYLPFEFTHQGAEWVSGSEAWLGREWKGNGSEKASISFNLDRVTQWSKDNNRPVWLGEFGAYSKADMDSRVRWTSYLARDAEKHKISWAYWEFGAGFGVYDLTQNAWRQPLLEALVP